MHMTYELVRKEETTATEEDKNQFHACKNDEQRAEMVLEYLKIKVRDRNLPVMIHFLASQHSK